ncbi:hypothetical protein GGU10DRAFT_380300 [Lentinula aff. detonsa]|uniref:Uncharacterized protein n=1 Tax=Lentinula aff. detonsa TaxID=2804958 RepID=A0AA38NJF6_9AGAR|nr:hypothetical protein GGU10DRAFT_380300 [Lentinula aff. detonsa]
MLAQAAVAMRKEKGNHSGRKESKCRESVTVTSRPTPCVDPLPDFLSLQMTSSYKPVIPDLPQDMTEGEEDDPSTSESSSSGPSTPEDYSSHVLIPFKRKSQSLDVEVELDELSASASAAGKRPKARVFARKELESMPQLVYREDVAVAVEFLRAPMPSRGPRMKDSIHSTDLPHFEFKK